MHDSLNIIYPTPPTPLQQFSPLNANPVLIEDPQFKRRRLARGDSEYSEMEPEEYPNDGNEYLEQHQKNGKFNEFLALENLTEVNLFNMSNVYCRYFRSWLSYRNADHPYLVLIKLKFPHTASVILETCWMRG
jgi:hypothetical protein